MLDSWFFCYTSSIIHYQYHRTLIKTKFIILWLNKSYISLSNVYTRIYDRRLGCYFLQNHDCTGTSIKYKKGKKILNKQYSNVKLTVLSFTRVYKKMVQKESAGAQKGKDKKLLVNLNYGFSPFQTQISLQFGQNCWILKSVSIRSQNVPMSMIPYSNFRTKFTRKILPLTVSETWIVGNYLHGS